MIHDMLHCHENGVVAHFLRPDWFEIISRAAPKAELLGKRKMKRPRQMIRKPHLAGRVRGMRHTIPVLQDLIPP